MYNIRKPVKKSLPDLDCKYVHMT